MYDVAPGRGLQKGHPLTESAEILWLGKGGWALGSPEGSLLPIVGSLTSLSRALVGDSLSPGAPSSGTVTQEWVQLCANKTLCVKVVGYATSQGRARQPVSDPTN